METVLEIESLDGQSASTLWGDVGAFLEFREDITALKVHLREAFLLEFCEAFWTQGLRNQLREWRSGTGGDEDYPLHLFRTWLTASRFGSRCCRWWLWLWPWHFVIWAHIDKVGVRHVGGYKLRGRVTSNTERV